MVEARYLLGNFVRNIFVDGHLEEEKKLDVFFIGSAATFTTRMLVRYLLS
jgi:hypothetical protein